MKKPFREVVMGVEEEPGEIRELDEEYFVKIVLTLVGSALGWRLTRKHLEMAGNWAAVGVDPVRKSVLRVEEGRNTMEVSTSEFEAPSPPAPPLNSERREDDCSGVIEKESQLQPCSASHSSKEIQISNGIDVCGEENWPRIEGDIGYGGIVVGQIEQGAGLGNPRPTEDPTPGGLVEPEREAGVIMDSWSGPGGGSREGLIEHARTVQNSELTPQIRSGGLDRTADGNGATNPVDAVQNLRHSAFEGRQYPIKMTEQGASGEGRGSPPGHPH